MFSSDPLGRHVLFVLSLHADWCPSDRLAAALARVGKPPARSTLAMTVARLFKAGLVRRRGKPAEFTLSRRGRVECSLPSPLSEAPPAPEGLLYFVTYDIPVRLGSVRDDYRVRLQDAGWQRLHRSLWIAERDIRDTAVFAAQDFGIDQHVFVGTGALATAVATRPGPGVEAEMIREGGAIREAAGRGASEAYRRWAALLARARGATGASWLSEEARRAVTEAGASVRAAIFGRVDTGGGSGGGTG